MPTLQDLYPELFGGPADTLQQNQPGFTTTLKRTAGQIAAGAGEAAHIAGFEDNALRSWGEQVIANNPSGINSFEDIANNPGLALAEGAGMAVGFFGPQAALRMGGLGLQAFGASRAGLAASAASGIGAAAASPWVGGAGLASLPSLHGIGESQRETGEIDLLAQIGGAAAVGAIEMAGGPQRWLRAAPPGRVIQGVTQQQLGEMASTPMRTFGLGVARMAGQEAGEELLQNPIEQFAGGHDPFSPESLHETVLGATMGAIGGAVPFGIGSGLRRASQHAGLNEWMGQTIGSESAPVPDQMEALGVQRHFTGDQGLYEQRLNELTERIYRGMLDGTPVNLMQAAQPLPEVMEAPWHAGMGAMAPGTDIETATSRAAGILRTAGQMPEEQWGDQMTRDVEMASALLQRTLPPAQYEGFLRQVGLLPQPDISVTPLTAPGPRGQVNVKVPQAKGVSPTPKIDNTPPFVKLYKEAGGIYSPVQKALAEVQTQEQAVEIVQNWLENKRPSQKVIGALEEMHKRLTGKTFTQVLQEREAAAPGNVGTGIAQPKVDPKAPGPVTITKGDPNAAGQTAPQGAAQQQAPAGPVQEVQAQAPAQDQGAGRQADQVPDEVDAMQMVLGELAQRDPVKAVVLDRFLQGQSDAEIAKAIGTEKRPYSKQRVQQIRQEAVAMAEGIARSKGYRPEQFRNQEEDNDPEPGDAPRASPRSSFNQPVEDVSALGLPTTGEDDATGADTGYRIRPVAEVNSSNIAGEVVVRTNKDGEATGELGEFIPDQEGQANTRARVLEAATAAGDVEAEAAVVWDTAAHVYTAQGDKMKGWSDIKPETKREWADFYAAMKSNAEKSDRQKDAGIARKLREYLKRASYINPDLRRIAGVDLAGLKPVSIGGSKVMVRAMAKRFEAGYGPLFKERLAGIFTAASGMPGDAFVTMTDDGRYVMVVKADVWEAKGKYANYPALIERMFQHELEHIVDNSALPEGNFSADPLLEPPGRFFGKGGALYQEIAEASEKHWWTKSMFLYPMDPESRKGTSGDNGRNAFMKELYAQIMSAYHVPQFRERLAQEVPGAYLFAERIDEKIRTQLAERVRAAPGQEDRVAQATREARERLARAFNARTDGPVGEARRVLFQAQGHEGFAAALGRLEADLKSRDSQRIQAARQQFLNLGRTPVVLRAVMDDAGNKPFRKSEVMTGTGSTVYLKGADIHQGALHGGAVPTEVLKRLPELLADPVAVFKSSKHSDDPNSFKVVIDAEVAGAPVVVAMRPNHPIREARGEPAHFTVTIFPLKRGWPMAGEWAEAGLLRYVNDQHPSVAGQGTSPQGGKPKLNPSVARNKNVVTKTQLAATPEAQWSEGLDDMMERLRAGASTAAQRLPKRGDVLHFRDEYENRKGQTFVVDEVILDDPKRPGGKVVGTVYEPDGVEARESTRFDMESATWVSQGRAAFSLANFKETQGIWKQMNDGVLFSMGLDELIANIPQEKQRAATTVSDAWAKAKPTLLTLHQLNDQYGEKLAALKDYVASMDKMEQRQNTLMNRAHSTLTKWQALHGQTRHALNSVMLDATTRGIHPDEEFGPDTPNAHVTDRDEYLALKRKYDALAPEAKALYKEVRQLLTDNWQARKEAFARAVTTAYDKLIAEAADDRKAQLTAERDKEIADHAKRIASIVGPYFPLLRFGDYLMIAESKELRALREKMEDAKGSEHTELRKQVERLKRDGKHYVVQAFESRYKAEQAAAQHRVRGLQVRTQLAEEHVRALQPVSAGAVDRIGERLAGQFDRDTAAKVKGLITELYISTLPEHAALQRQLRRQGIEGATTDMLRAVAQTVEKDAFYLSRMEFADELTGNLEQIRKDTKGDIDLGHVYRNLTARVALDFQYRDTPIQNFVARMSGIWHLGMSPAYLLTNASQPWMITAPVLAGKFGLSRSLGALRAAWVDAVNIIRQSKKDGAFADINFNAVADQGERAMLKAVMDRGQIDITQNLDMGLIADGTDPRFLKLQKAFNWTNHHIEASNRIVTALAAYRLARSQGMAQQAAQDYAFKQVVDTQLNYTDANAAYWMKRGAVPLGKLIFQFRKYQQGMLYLLARNAQLAFQGDKEARRALGYLAATQLAMAGAVGIPVVTGALSAWSLFADDDDEEGDPETQIRNYLADAMGPEAARVFWKGLPTLMGLDVSQRIGMGDIWKPLPFLRLTGKTGTEDMGQLVAGALGAPLGMLGRMWDGAKLMEKGDWQKGVEKMMPKMLADVVKAERYADEGISTRAGTVTIRPDRLDGWDVVFRAAGFSPAIESEYYEAMGAKENVSRAIEDGRKNLLAQYANARLAGRDVGAVMQDIAEWNRKHSAKGARIDRSSMLQAVQARRRGAKELSETGVRFQKNQRALQGIDRFARGA